MSARLRAPLELRLMLRSLSQRASARLDALPSRERLALAVAVLALLGAIEWFFVLPLRAQRQAVTDVTEEQARADSDARSAVEQKRAAAESALHVRLAEIDRVLAQRGAGQSRGETLSALLSRALVGQPAQLLALRDLGVEPLDTAPAADPAAAAGAAGAPSPSAGARPETPAAAQATLYRHRYELALAADVSALAAALRQLADRLPPLRIERVRMLGRDDGSVEATLTLTVIGTERTWVSL